MRMLEAGGFPVYGRKPYIEDSEPPFPRTLGAVKRLDDTVLHVLPRNPRIIWLHRDLVAQGYSWAKFLDAIKLPYTMAPFAIAEWLRQRENDHLNAIEAAGCEIFHLAFEGLLSNPVQASIAVANWLNDEMDTMSMAQCVMPRDAACSPYMEIPDAILKRLKVRIEERMAA